MGLPEIHVEFQEKKKSFIHRLGRGMVAIAFVNAAFTATKIVACDDVAEVAKAVEGLPQEQKDAVEAEMMRALSRGAAKVIAVCAKDVTALESALSAEKFNYLAIGNVEAGDQTEVVSWAKARGFMCGRHFIVVGHHGLASAQDAHVVALDAVNLTDEACTTAAVAGVLAGLSEQSGTYYVMNPKLRVLNKHALGYTRGKTYDFGDLVEIKDMAMFEKSVRGTEGNCVDNLIIRTNTVCVLQPKAFNASTDTGWKAQPPLKIYVPDNLVSQYQTATNWSIYADRIKPLSQYVEV